MELEEFINSKKEKDESKSDPMEAVRLPVLSFGKADETQKGRTNNHRYRRVHGWEIPFTVQVEEWNTSVYIVMIEYEAGKQPTQMSKNETDDNYQEKSGDVLWRQYEFHVMIPFFDA